jgi:hypothetical protein
MVLQIALWAVITEYKIATVPQVLGAALGAI